MSVRRGALALLLTAGCSGGGGEPEPPTGEPGSGGSTGGERASTGELTSGSTTGATTGSTEEPTGGSSTGGSTGPACPPEQVVCAGECVDVAVDPAHCGECDKPCPMGQACDAGACELVCADGLVACGGGCVDATSDPAHCGGCELACEPGDVCQGGGCVTPCAPEEIMCGEACVDPLNDDAHCGGCDQPCPAGVPCMAGQCPQFDIHHVLITGQSLATGYHSAVVSDAQKYTNLSFSTGVRAGAIGLDGFAPLVETWDGKHGETIASGMANFASSLWEAAGFTRQDMLMSGHGVDSRRYDLIKKGTEAYAAGMAQIAAAQAIAAAQEQTYAVRALAVVHGESDHSDYKATLGNPEYAADLVEWRGDYEAAAQAITGQTVPVIMFYCQMSSWTAYGTATSTIPGQQWQVSREGPQRFMLIGPKYFLPYVDIVHLTGDGIRWLGEFYAKAYTRVFLTGEPWRPLEPVGATRRGSTIAIDFVAPAPPLVLDTTMVSDPGNYGFEFVDGSASPPEIKAVELTGPEQVTLTLAAEPTGPTPTVRYASTGIPGAPAGATTGPRGNLRDSDATPSLNGYPLYNWAIHFEIAVQ